MTKEQVKHRLRFAELAIGGVSNLLNSLAEAMDEHCDEKGEEWAEGWKGEEWAYLQTRVQELQDLCSDLEGTIHEVKHEC